MNIDLKLVVLSRLTQNIYGLVAPTDSSDFSLVQFTPNSLWKLENARSCVSIAVSVQSSLRWQQMIFQFSLLPQDAWWWVAGWCISRSKSAPSFLQASSQYLAGFKQRLTRFHRFLVIFNKLTKLSRCDRCTIEGLIIGLLGLLGLLGVQDC